MKNSEKININKKIRNKYVFTLAILFLILIVSSTIAIIYMQYIQNLIHENTLKNLGELTKQDAAKIENKIDEDVRILDSICNEIVFKKLTNKNDMFNIYNNNEGKMNFARMAILYKNGDAFTNDGKELSLLSDIEYFFGNDMVQVSGNRKSKIDENEINIYSKKININTDNINSNNIDGNNINDEDIVIMLVVETEQYERLFSRSIYGGRGYEYIVDSSLDVIASSHVNDDTKNIYNLLNNNINENISVNKGKLDEIKGSIVNKNEIENQFIVEIEGHDIFISCNPLDINDWVLVIITPGSIVIEELNGVIKSIFVVAIIIILLILCISSYIIISNINKKQKLYDLAYIDPITKLGNYYFFLKTGQEVINKSYADNIYVLIIDIEKFRSFNQKYGHAVGNDVLIQMSIVLKQALNKYEDSIICRFSNDIFGILIEVIDNDIEKVAKLIFEKLSIITLNNISYNLSPVIGIYRCREKDDILEAIDKATIAHDEIIGNFNAKYNIFDRKTEEKIIKEHEIEEIMEEALKNDEFFIYYQPKINLSNKKEVLAEALVRWNRNNKIIPPGEFIPLFEKNRFILKLDLYIFEHVCIDLRDWKNEFKICPKISINVSKEHFDNPNFIDDYVYICNKYNIDKSSIELEITESASSDKNINLMDVMNSIKKENFQISLDDFGTGYSSLNMLEHLPIDTIKIDKSFIDNIENEDKKIDLIKYILKMSKELNIKTVAEGVENKFQLEYLKLNNCDIIQGYYFSKPLSKNEFEKYLKKYKF